MWREIALEKLKSGSGTLSFKTQREINEIQRQRIEELNESLAKLHELNIKFHEITTNTTRQH